MQRKIIKGAMLAATLVAMLGSFIWLSGCKVEVLPTRDQQKQAEQQKKAGEAVNVVPVPDTDNAAAVIASCGPAASDEVMNVNDKLDSGNVRRLVYRGSRETTLDFIPLQSGNGHGAASSHTVWRFNKARVDNQTLLTAANIRVYLPCAGAALAKEF